MMNWFGTLPERWESKRIGALLKQRKERNDPVQTDFILSLSAAHGVVPYSERIEKGGNRPKDDLSKYSIARKDDLLINCMNVLAGSSGVTKWDGAISPVYYALHPRNDDVNILYYNYIFRLITFYRSLIGLGKGILFHESSSGKLNTIRLRIAMTNLNNVMLPLPPREEQDQIVRYLDWKVSQINKLINAKRRQVGLLQEQKRVVINSAMTKGGEGWQYRRLKTLVKDINEKDSPQNKFYIGMENIKSWTTEYINTGVTVDGDSKRFKQGDVLFGKLRPYLAKIYIPGCDGVCSGEFLVLRGYNGYLSFLKYFLLSYDFIMLVNASTYGAKMPRANWDFIGNCVMPYPTFEEQEAVAKRLDVQSTTIDKLVAKINDEIGRLQEYRTCLISDVITGRVDVRCITIPEYELSTDDPINISEDEGDNSIDEDMNETEE